MSLRRPHGGSSLHTLPMSFVVLDLETTGRSFSFDNIIEVGALKVTNGRADKKFSALVKIDRHIPHFATDLTGITDEMLQSQGRDAQEVIRCLERLIGDYVIIAHNANFDMTFLYLAYEQYLGRPLTNDFVDMLPMSRRALPDLEHHRLGNLCEALDVCNKRWHRAIEDAYAEYCCYIKMRKILLKQYGTEEAYAQSFDTKAKSHRHLNLKNALATDFVSDDKPDESNPLYGMNVVFTGTMEMMVRNEAKKAVRLIGGIPQQNVTKATDYVVIGNAGYQREMTGPSAKIKKAQQNASKGLPVQIISEDTFIEMLQS